MIRLLILSPDYSKRVNWGHQHIRDKLLSIIPNSIQYGEKCKHDGSTYIPDICKEVEPEIGYPNVILMENPKNMARYEGGAEVDCLKILIACDYFGDDRGNYSKYNEIINKHRINMLIGVTPQVVRNIILNQKLGAIDKWIKVYWIPHSVDTSIFKPREELERIHDVMAVFGLVSYVYPNRPNVQSLIESMTYITSLVGDWSTNIKRFNYARAINQSRIFVNSNGVNSQVLMKYFEVLASGTLLLTDRPNDYKYYGLIPGKHFVVWSTLSELKFRIYKYLENSEDRKRIARQGMEYVRKNYSTDIMAGRIENLMENNVNS